MTKLFLKLVMLTLLFPAICWSMVTAYPGGVAMIPIESRPRPQVFFGDKKILTIKQNGKWVAYVGLDVDQPLGEAKVEIHIDGDIIREKTFNVVAKNYPVQEIYIKDKSKVTPSSQNLERINAEAVLLNKAFAHWQEKSLNSLLLQKPVSGRVSGDFGLKRVINGKPRSSHKGIDIAAARGTPIQSAKDGVVTLTGDFFFTGKTVVVDHGQGFQTVYCHLDELDVELDDFVLEGQLIGKVGQTGRATGPHLHFGMILNQARVDPSLFWKLNN